MTDDEYSPEHATAERRCSNCTHYSPSTGECKRYPPTIIQRISGELGSYFPDTYSDWVCGEHDWGWGTQRYIGVVTTRTWVDELVDDIERAGE